MLPFERPVQFEEIDAAGLVFFPRFFHWCHEAMTHLFDGMPGGYADLIVRRRVGFPAVHVESDYKSPVRFGDVVRVETNVSSIGTTSVGLRFELFRASSLAAGPAQVHVATIRHVVVAMDLDALTKTPVPADCRAILETHLDTP